MQEYYSSFTTKWEGEAMTGRNGYLIKGHSVFVAKLSLGSYSEAKAQR